MLTTGQGRPDWISLSHGSEQVGASSRRRQLSGNEAGAKNATFHSPVTMDRSVPSVVSSQVDVAMSLEFAIELEEPPRTTRTQRHTTSQKLTRHGLPHNPYEAPLRGRLQIVTRGDGEATTQYSVRTTPIQLTTTLNHQSTALTRCTTPHRSADDTQQTKR